VHLWEGGQLTPKALAKWQRKNEMIEVTTRIANEKAPAMGQGLPYSLSLQEMPQKRKQQKTVQTQDPRTPAPGKGHLSTATPTS